MIKLIKSTFYKENETKRALNRFITQAKVLSFGSQCEKFEESFSHWQNRKSTVLLNSGSSANLAIIQALLNLGILSKGDAVGFSAVTWSTNVMPIIQLGLEPIPIDVEIDTLNISPKTLGLALKKSKIRALFLTNLLGFCDDIKQIARVCKENNIVLIEDNCESLGSEVQNTKLGNFGLASTFSFYVGHHMSTIEGGAICTDNDALAEMLKLVRAHGWDRNLQKADQQKLMNKHHVQSSFYSRYTFYDLGYNLRPTEIIGFLGNFQIKFLKNIISRREKNYFLLSSLYKQTNLFHPVTTNHMSRISNFAFPLVCRSVEIRDALIKRAEGKVELRPIVGGNMVMQPFFAKYKKGKEYSCPNAEYIHTHGLYFGNNPELTKSEIRQLIHIFSLPNV